MNNEEKCNPTMGNWQTCPAKQPRNIDGFDDADVLRKKVRKEAKRKARMDKHANCARLAMYNLLHPHARRQPEQTMLPRKYQAETYVTDEALTTEELNDKEVDSVKRHSKMLFEAVSAVVAHRPPVRADYAPFERDWPAARIPHYFDDGTGRYTDNMDLPSQDYEGEIEHLCDDFANLKAMLMLLRKAKEHGFSTKDVIAWLKTTVAEHDHSVVEQMAEVLVQLSQKYEKTKAFLLQPRRHHTMGNCRECLTAGPLMGRCMICLPPGKPSCYDYGTCFIRHTFHSTPFDSMALSEWFGCADPRALYEENITEWAIEEHCIQSKLLLWHKLPDDRHPKTEMDKAVFSVILDYD